MLKEYKEFALKGNVLELAIAVVIGGAFGKIVSSLVNDIIMPIMGVLTGGINLSYLRLIIKEGKGDIPAITLNYGTFIQSTIDFLIISFCIFMIIRFINRFKRENKANVPEQETPKVSDEVLLLQEIRDLLKRK
ncbi:MAG: large-conductance mechanosensitive channel protein MscL [Acetivibrionales bacterium]